MELRNVRRLTGASLALDRSGAVGELEGIGPGGAGPTLSLWRLHAQALLEAVGWAGETVAVRPYEGGASLAVTAPVDGLYAATDLVEAAWRLTRGAGDAEAEAAALREKIEEEATPEVAALAAAAAQRGVTFLAGDGELTVGLGARGEAWPEDAPPAPETVAWDRLGDVPLALVTGTNGKSTSVRLAAAILAAAGKTVGQSSSDWVRVGEETLDEGDYSGPAGARMAVRDPRVEAAVLEAARGGLMRRGLPVPHADACLITNIAADHLGDYGIVDVPTLAEAKFLVARALRPGGRLALNADDPELARRGAAFPGEVAWFSLDPAASGARAWAEAGGGAAWLEDGALTLARDGAIERVIAAADVPLAMGGAARFNIANALGAMLVADALGAPVEAMRAGLAGFAGSAAENPGRGNFIELGGVTVVVDFAHNPHGLAALLEALAAREPRRVAVQLGQAGDRSDDDIRAMAGVAQRAGAGLFAIKEVETKLRGRRPGEVPALLEDELRALGVPGDAILRAPDEIAATRAMLEQAEPGDLLVLLIYSERDAVMSLLDGLSAKAWRPGDPLEP